MYHVMIHTYIYDHYEKHVFLIHHILQLITITWSLQTIPLFSKHLPKKSPTHVIMTPFIMFAPDTNNKKKFG